MNTTVSSPPGTSEALAPAMAVSVTAFARACRAAARAVSLYPPEHPTVGAALQRVVEAARQVAAGGEIRLGVLPGALAVEGAQPARPDAAVGELAALLHAHQIGQLAIAPQSDGDEWRRFLSLLGLPPEQTRFRGGLAALWASEGQTRISVRRIDYHSLLLERVRGERATWDAIVEQCLEGDVQACDDWMLDLVLEILNKPDDVNRLVEEVERRVPTSGGRGPGVVTGLFQAMAQFVARVQPEQLETVLIAMASAAVKLPAETLAPVAAFRRDARRPDRAQFVATLAQRMSDVAIADRIVQAFSGGQGTSALVVDLVGDLVPDVERRSAIVALARNTLEQTAGAQGSSGESQPQLEQLLAEHDSRPFVSDDYASELQDASARAVDLDADLTDAPARIKEWVDTVSDERVRLLDANLLVDLMQLTRHVEAWRASAALAVARVNVMVVLGDFATAAFIVEALRLQHEDHPTPEIKAAAVQTLDEILNRDLMRHVASHLDTADPAVVTAAKRFCHAIGTSVIPLLAEVLSHEERARSRHHLIAVLKAFGAAGRQSVERLMHSANASVRRTAVHLLQAFGGTDALPELASLLNDEEPHVQREATRAIVLLGIEPAYQTLTRALAEGSAQSMQAMTGILWALPTEDTAPLLVYIVSQAPRGGRLRPIHERAMQRLGVSGGHAAVEALGEALHRGSALAPFSTAALRRHAADALARIGSPEAIERLQAAVGGGSWGVRSAARAALSSRTASGAAASRGR